MATSVDMSLDDLIKKNRERGRRRGRGGHARGRGRGRSGSFGGERMTGPVRRGPLAVNARPSSYMIAKPARRTRSLPWQHNLFEDSLRAAGISGVEVGTKLYVSNLDSGVSNEDIRELFSQIGDLKRYAIHYDKNGRPGASTSSASSLSWFDFVGVNCDLSFFRGSAEVVYARRSDAFAALKRYNNVLLDGKPMKLEVVGDNAEIPVSARVNVTGVNGGRKRTTPGAGLNGGASSINRGSGKSSRGAVRNGRGRAWGRGQGRGRGRGRGRKQPVDKSADELDKDLEKYHTEAMQT